MESETGGAFFVLSCRYRPAEASHPSPHPIGVMHKYRTVRNALSIFSVQTGLDEVSARQALQDSLGRPAWRASLERELEALMADERQSRIDLVAKEAGLPIERWLPPFLLAHLLRGRP